MPRFAANLSLMFTELPFLDRFAAASRAGFKGVEFLFPYDWPCAEIEKRLSDNGLQLVLFNLPPGDWGKGERGLTACAGREVEFAAGLAQALDYASALGVKQLHAMAGLEAHGARAETYVANLRLAATRAAAHAITILIEPINTFDMPGYFLTRTEDARGIVTEVGAPNLGLQLDLYHRHRMQGGALQAIADYADITRHYQIAGPPDRGEPDGGELDFRPLFRAIDASGFTGWIGCEYRPRNGTEAGLAWPGRLGVTLG